MPNISLPTDNLYKFISIVGLIIAGISIFLVGHFGSLYKNDNFSEIQLNDIRNLVYSFIILMQLGVLISCKGFYLWYYKLQIYIDLEFQSKYTQELELPSPPKWLERNLSNKSIIKYIIEFITQFILLIILKPDVDSLTILLALIAPLIYICSSVIIEILKLLLWLIGLGYSNIIKEIKK